MLYRYLPTLEGVVYTSPDEVTTMTEGDSLTGGDVLPGFSLPLRQLFARVPRKTARRNGRRKGKGHGKRKR
jgi:hypothetical protein